MAQKKTIIIASIIFISLTALVYYSIKSSSENFTEKEIESLAKCLTDKEIYLYGTINCPNCDVQKEKFGEASDKIVYINCFADEKKCEQYIGQKIYPFWGMGNSMIPGPVPLEKLKGISGC